MCSPNEQNNPKHKENTKSFEPELFRKHNQSKTSLPVHILLVRNKFGNFDEQAIFNMKMIVPSRSVIENLQHKN